MKTRKEIRDDFRNKMFVIDCEFLVKRFKITHDYEQERKQIEIEHKNKMRKLNLQLIVCILVVFTPIAYLIIKHL